MYTNLPFSGRFFLRHSHDIMITMHRKLIFILIPVAVMLAGIVVYHKLVVLELLTIVERMQVAQMAVPPGGGGSRISDGIDGDSDPDTAELSQTVERMDAKGAAFEIPHAIIAGGTQQKVILGGKVLSIAKYVSTDISQYGTVVVDACNGKTCAATQQQLPLTRTQAIVAVDLEFTNNNRMGPIAIDPAKQFRVLIGTSFYTPSALTGDAADYIEVPELASYNATFIARIPAGAESFRLIFGEDIQNPMGLFDVNLKDQTIEAIGG
jgi:hypothetical protein